MMRYRIFGRHTGLRVSELALGAANFGTGWGYGTEAKDARPIFDAYVTAGGNFIDTSDQYQFGQSEQIIGEFVGADRAQFIIASKFTGGDAPNAGVSATGNSRKNMVRSVEASLKRLKMDYIDLYWVHFPDLVTPIDEIVRGLDDLVSAGKILYSGFSDFPAWRVSRAATIAELRGWAPIAGIQIEYSLVERTPERELLPMARGLGLGTVTWSPLAGGLLTGKYRQQGAKGRATDLGAVVHGEDSAQKTAILDAVIALAEEIGCAPSHVALAWVRSKGHITILGPRTLSQIDDNLKALDIVLTPDQLQRLDAVSAVALGFPHDFMAKPEMVRMVAGGASDRIDYPPYPVV